MAIKISLAKDQAPIARKSGKTSQPNPFDPAVAEYKDQPEAVLDATGYPSEAAVKTAVNQLRRAARAANRSALVEVTGPTSFKFQLVAKIIRKPKGTAAAS